MSEKEKLVFVTNDRNQYGGQFHHLKVGHYATVIAHLPNFGRIMAQGQHKYAPGTLPQILEPEHYMPVNWEL